MALDEHDRENLLRDGTAMNVRGEIELDLTPVIVGFRKDGQASFYFGPDVVFQLNASRELRRVFWFGRRLAAHQGYLVELTRPDRGGKVSFERIELDTATRDSLLRGLEDRLFLIKTSIDGSSMKWRTEGMGAAEFCRRLQNWVENLPSPVQVAQNPNA